LFKVRILYMLLTPIKTLKRKDRKDAEVAKNSQ
jgi:hypothetical protein